MHHIFALMKIITHIETLLLENDCQGVEPHARRIFVELERFPRVFFSLSYLQQIHDEITMEIHPQLEVNKLLILVLIMSVKMMNAMTMLCAMSRRKPTNTTSISKVACIVVLGIREI